MKQDSNEIILFLTKPICYASNHYFVYELKQAFDELGVAARIVDLVDEQSREENMEALVGKSFRAMIDFNSILPKLRLEDGSYVLDLIDAPFYDYIVDHPLYHHPVLVNQVKNFHVLCIDWEHKAYVEKYYPHIQSVGFLPLGGMEAQVQVPFQKRRYPILLTATHTPSKEVWKRRKLCSEGIQTELGWVREILQEDRTRTQQEALEILIKRLGAEITKEQFREMMNFHFLTDMYLRAWEREQVVRMIAESGYEIDIFGHAWDLFLEEYSLAGKKNVHIHPAVSFAVSLELMANTKLCLNVNPRFHHGAHDRVFSAMVNGSVALTDPSAYLHKEFEAGEQLVFYDMKNIMNNQKMVHRAEWEKNAKPMEKLLAELFDSPGKLEEIAAGGQKVARKKHMWVHRAKELDEKIMVE